MSWNLKPLMLELSKSKFCFILCFHSTKYQVAMPNLVLWVEEITTNTSRAHRNELMNEDIVISKKKKVNQAYKQEDLLEDNEQEQEGLERLVQSNLCQMQLRDNITSSWGD